MLQEIGRKAVRVVVTDQASNVSDYFTDAANRNKPSPVELAFEGETAVKKTGKSKADDPDDGSCSARLKL